MDVRRTHERGSETTPRREWGAAPDGPHPDCDEGSSVASGGPGGGSGVRGLRARRVDRRLVVALAGALADVDLARLGLLRDRHPDREHAVVEVSLEVLEVEALAELDLTAERTAI